MDLVGSFAGASGLSSAGLGSRSDSKKIKAHVESVYLHGPSYKKTKLPGVSSGSEVDSKEAGVSKVSDIENLENMVAEKMSYVDPNASETDKIEDNATPRKTHTRTFILEQPLKAICFTSMSNDNFEMVLPGAKFTGSNWLLFVISRVLVRRAFGPVKSFALDVELSNVLGKTNSNKLISIKKIFYCINGFEGASTLSKLPEIIRSIFTSESSLNKAKLIVVNENISVNSDFKKVNISLDWEVIVKKIPVNFPKLAIEAVFSKFGVINSIKIQLIGLWQKAVIEFESAETLLYTLPIGTTAHDLVDLLESYDGKTCFIGHNPSSYVHDRCTIICFENEASKLAAFGSVSVFKGVSLHWAGLFLACCTACKQYSHTSEVCSVGGNFGSCGRRVVTDLDYVYLASIYKKKQASVTCPVFFGGRTWASVVGASLVCSSHGTGLILGSNKVGKPLPPVANDLKKHLVNIESSLISLAGQIGELAKRLDSLVLANQGENIVMRVGLGDATGDKTAAVLGSTVSPEIVKLENMLEGLFASVMSLSVHLDGLALAGDDVIHWHKDMNNLVSIVMESKLKRKVCPWLADKFDGVRVFTSDLDSGSLGAEVLIIMNSSLAKHVCKVSEMPGQLLSIKLIFKNKLSISILGLYAGASSVVWFSQAGEINSLIAKAVNESSFVILGGDFNENGLHKCASFKKCFDLGLINSLEGSFFTLDYMFISFNLVGAAVDCGVNDIEDYFDTDHKAVYVSVELGGLLDYDIKNASEIKWSEFRNATAANAVMFSDEFKKWFKGFDCVFNKVSSQFHKLELLVSKLVKASQLNRLNSVSTLLVKSLFLSGVGFDAICSGLAKVRKSYCSSKLLESKRAEESSVRQAIERRMESFKMDKSHIIRSVLEHSFRKVVLDHLVDGGELVLESKLVKSKVDGIMEGWTRKRVMASNISGDWARQFQPLDYVFDGAFSDVMHSISFNEMFDVISNLPNGKAAGFSGITNEL
ncbi:hypothetical protein G9A89_001076 [Geosiphon pyriformis]|nr:hypothetical protein G9A89_001076 [Geosiphon pyriformis]